jgi:hypothetical protein
MHAVSVPECGNLDESGGPGGRRHFEIGWNKVLIPVKFVFSDEIHRPAPVEIEAKTPA